MKRPLTLIFIFAMLLILSACNGNSDNTVSIYSDQSVLSNTTHISGSETATSEKISVDDKESKSDNDSINTDSSNISIEKSTTTKPFVAQSQTSKPSSSGSSNESSKAAIIPSSEENNTIKNISITVGGSVFSIKLYDNNAAKALLSQLPMKINMSELNGNEKYYYLSGNLPIDSEHVGNIHAGDLMLYGSNCLVLFYEDFQSSYSYTKLGFIENTSGLVAALGSGSVQISLVVSD